MLNTLSGVVALRLGCGWVLTVGAALGAALVPGSARAQLAIELGPAPVTGFSGASGRVSGIACSPTDPNTYYIGTADGGVWKTTSGGLSWAPLTDHLPTTAIGAVALDPSDERVVYAGSGEANFANHCRYGLGVYKSVDAGATWRVLARETFAGRCFSRIIVDPAAPMVVYGAVTGAGGGPERFAAKGHPGRAGIRGVFKSVDGGETWAPLSGGLPAVDATDLAMDPVDSGTLYAAIGHVYGDSGNGIYKSTDAGATWTRLSAGLPAVSRIGRVSLAIAPSNRTRLYAFVAAPSTGIGIGGSSSGGGGQEGAFRTDDGGATWTGIGVPAIMGSQGFYNNTVIVNPANADLVYFGGVSLVRSTSAGGGAFPSMSIHHPDVHAAAYDASGRLVIGNDGGICRDTGPQSINFPPLNAGLGNLQFYAGLSTHPTDSRIIFGGLQDNGTARRDGPSLTWTTVGGGDGGWTQVNQADPAFVFIQSQGSGALRRSSNGGQSFAGAGVGLTGRHCFLPPFLLDPRVPGRMLWANERVFASSDNGSNFAPRSADLTGGPPFAIRALAMAPSDAARVYAATSDSRVLASADGGTNFTLRLTDAHGWPRVTRELSVSAIDPLRVYLAGARFGGPKVRRSTDAGATWVSLDGDLPDVPVNVLAVDERYTVPRIYAGGDDGVYRSDNGGVNWRRIAENLPRAAYIDLILEVGRPADGWMGGGRLIAATQGRGAWMIPVPCVADFNADGLVDPDDLSDMISCYFAQPPCDRADFSGDTAVDPDDLADFISAYFSPSC